MLQEFLVLSVTFLNVQALIPENVLSFQPGKIYHYHFSVHSNSVLMAFHNQSVFDQIEGQAKLRMGDNGQLEIALQSVGDPGRADRRNEAHCDKPHIGSPDSEVCVTLAEKPWLENLKRALLSHFQMTAKSLEVPSYTAETDISGECLTEYVPQRQSSTIIKMVKRKYTTGCSKRFDYRSTMQLISTQKPKQSQKIPHLDGSLVCSQIIELDVGLLNSTCDEIIVIARNGNSLDKTVVHVQTALRRLKTDDTVSTGVMTGFSGSIEPTFDLKNYHIQTKKDISGEKSKFVQIVRDVYLTNSPRSMYKAIRQSRLLSYSEQKAMMDEILEEDHADIRKVYAGILVETGTVAAFKFLRENAEKLGLTSSDILSALKKISYPDADLLQIMIELLRDDEVTRAALPVSGAVQTFCHQHPHCQDYGELTQIVDLITKKIGTQCIYTDKEQMNQIIIALRALGNMGRLLQSRLATILSACLENPEVDVSVQVTAIEALRLTDCSQQFDNIMILLMADQLRDIELRIFAYRSYMRCPMEHKLPKILNLLQNESSQQFGSYVYSHLTNLAGLVGPIAEPWTDIIGPFEKRIAHFRRKFALNRRSFSKHYGSFYRFKNVGVNVETSVIFGPESPLPRHVSVNLTIDLFDGQLQFLEFGIRSTEQSQLWKNLLKPTVSAVFAPLDALEKLIRKQRKLEKMTTAFLRIGAQDQWYTSDLKKTIYDLLVLSKSSESNPIKSELLVNNMIVIDSSLFVPTIGGFPIEINYLALKTSRKGSANRILFAPGEGQVNWTSSSHLSFGTQLKVAGFQHRTTINQWWSLSFDANLHGAVRYTRQANHKEGRIYLKNWNNDQLALKYKYHHYAILDDAVVPNSINSPQMTLLSETPTYVDTLLGVKATSKVVLAEKSSDVLPIEAILCVNQFRGLDARFELERSGDGISPVKRCYLLFNRPGESDLNGAPKSHLELSFEIGPVNQTAQFVHLRLIPPWQHELSVRADYSQNGILHATGNLSSTPWTIYGVYTESDESQRFTARIQYPTGTLTLTFRGNLTGNFKLQIHNADSSWPEPLELTQRVINSRHTYYPSFKRFHHDTRLRLRDDQVLSLQLEWNSGRRNGRLEQGVIRVKQTNKQNRSELQSALTWTEGDATSRLDKTVDGYSRQLRVETKVVQHDNNPLTFSVGMDQFFSKNIWMIHTDLPAIISFNAWSYSPDMPSLQLNYSTACTYRYRLDQGGSFEAFSVLNIPSANIDALAQADLQWRSIRKAGVSWIQDLSSSVTLRIFPPENDRYFRVNISHTIMQNVITVASVEFDSKTLYMLESTLYRGLPVHSFRVRWPPDQEMVMNTTYLLQVGPKTAIAFKHLLARNDNQPVGTINTEFVYHMETNKLLIRHNSTKFIEGGSQQLIAGFEWGNELHGKVTRNPLRIKFKAYGLLQVQIPILEIDGRIEALLGNHFGPQEAALQGRLMYTRPMSNGKYGVDFNCEIATQQGTVLQSNLNFYLSGQPVRSSGCDFKFNASESTRMIALECSKESLGSVFFHDKFRHRSKQDLEGSNMLAIIPKYSTERFKGWYSNYNYAVSKFPFGFSLEIRGEFTPNSGVGPGSPVRLRIHFTGDKSYRTGTMETVINSQHVGYWTGYEMATTMTRYELSGLETKDKERKLTVRSIMGVRLLEGRGTRAFESGFQMSISPHGDQFLIQLKAGQPGRTRDNSVQFQYSMESTRPLVSLELILFSVKECFIQSEISYDPSGRFGGALLEFIVPRLNASNRMKITRKHDSTELLVVSQDETYIDAPMILSEKFPTDPSADPEIVTCSFSGTSSNGVQQTPIHFSYSIWKTNSQKSIRAMNMSLNFGLDEGTSKHFVNLGISSGEDSTDSNQIYVRTTYPWAIEASFSFGQKLNKGCVYRHNIHQLAKDGDLGWTSRADCSIDAFYSTSCGLSYLSQARIFNASLDGRPDQGIYQTELAWDRSHNGMIQTMVKGFRSIYLRTPLRQIEINMQSEELKPANKSEYVLTNYTLATSDPESHSADRDFYSTLLVYQLTDRTDDQRNWTYGAKLLSSMLSRESVECNLTIQSSPDQLSFGTNLFTGDQLDHKINLHLTSDEAQEDVVRSKLELKTQDNEYSLIGLYVLRSSYMTSELTLSHPISWASAGRWNITIDSWNQFQLTNFNETKISSHTWRNSTHSVLQQIVFVNSGLLNMSHLSSLQLSPFHLDSILDSRSGRAWITGRKTGAKEFLIDTEHSPSGADWSVPNRRKDLVARFLLDPENTFHVNLNWRPGLINEILLHGTELSDVESVKLLLQNPIPVASTVRELLTMFSDENSASLISHRDLKAWLNVSVSDLNRMFTTIHRWWKDDQFYLRTLKVPVIERLGEFNVTDLAYNITSFRAVLLDEIGRILQKAAEDDLFRLEQLEELKLKIERNRFPLFKPTFEAMVRMTSGVIWASGQFANFLFYKVAACTNAVYTLKQSLRAWIDHQYTWMSNLSQTPFAVQLGAFLTRLQVDVPALRPVSCFCNTMMESVTALVRQLIQYVQRLALGAITDKEMLELLTMMSNGHVENASQLFFKPHLTRFTADLENGLVKLSVHVPKLFERLIDSAFGSQSYPRQILSWIYPSRGMKSIMYAYDQYQHNFEAMRKLVHLIPPYKVTSWLMIDSENNAYVVTFNGLFIPVKKPHWGPYLLVANTDQDRKLRVIHEFADLTKEGGWRTKITIGSMTIYVTHEGQVREIISETGELVCLPYFRKLDSLARLEVTRNGDRIVLRVHDNNRQRELISILFDVRLRYLRVQLDGAWHGQCRGLLGTNDFEQMHEMLDPRTGRMWNQSDMARLWSYTTVGENTTDKSQATVGSRLPSRSSNLCNDMWQRFQPCFAYVNPDPWIEACDYSIDLPKFSKSDAKVNRVEWNDRSCMVARAYIHSCNLQDVPVRVPHQCVSCELNDEKDVANILPEDNFPANTRRITFVIEMGSCFDRRRKEIVELLILLNKSKQSQPVQYSAFLFTSLSGTTETTRLTSNNGVVWMSGEQFLQTLSTFDQQKDVSLWEQRTSEFVEWPRATEALSRAIRQPAGSAGTHDSVLLYICSGCTPEGSQYKTLIRVIKRKGIDFHYIPESSFTTVGDLHRNVFLLTSDEHYDKLFSDGSIRRVVNSGTVNAPRDHCSLIAQGSEGLIWAYQNVATTKQRLRAIITSMASHLSRPIGMQRQCVCRDNLYGAGVLDCSVSLNKTAENVKLMPIN